MDRIKTLCSYLDKCETFADVGCDHGYCTLYMLKNGLCRTAVISDISAKCLEKAQKLLKDYISENRVTAVCCNGLEKIDPDTEEILIAGMGGDEIVAILKNSFLPEKFVFQPMKNVESSGKFYTVIKGSRTGAAASYGEAELEYGLNLSLPSAQEFLKSELKKKLDYLERPLNAETRSEIEAQANLIRGVIKK